MIVALLGRIIGPVSTLALLAYLGQYSPEYTAQYAILVVYMQLATAPLNPYVEHFQLRELMSGRRVGYGAGLTAISLICFIIFILVYMLEQQPAIILIVPLLSLGHLFNKVLATKFRAKKRNDLAVLLEFSLRPVLLLILTISVFTLAIDVKNKIDIVFFVSAIILLAIVLLINKFVNREHENEKNKIKKLSANNRSSPWPFIILGILMVLSTQFEIFALDRFSNSEELATYKVALQLSSVCGIVTNFILLNNLRALYSHPPKTHAYIKIFRKVKVQTATISILFAVLFSAIALILPVFWSYKIWLLAAFGAFVFSISASFGPLTNWFYSTGHLSSVGLAFILMISIKCAILFALINFNMVTSLNLLLSYAAGVIAQNLFLTFRKRKIENYRTHI